MSNTIINMETDKALFTRLDKALSESIDNEIIHDLDHWLNIVRTKSKALSSSLKRCFDNARNSMRYVEAYKLGQKDGLQTTDNRQLTTNNTITPSSHYTIINSSNEDNNLEEYLDEKLKDFFNENDFMHYREFVRLLRACTIDVGGEVSSEIKKRYKNYFAGKRLIYAYNLGRKKIF